MKKFLVATLALALMAMAPYSSQAQVSFIDTNLGATEFSTFDWNPGNALAVNSTPLSTDPLNQTPFELYYQASLGNFLDGNGNAIAGTGLGSDYEVTIQVGTGETGWNLTAGNQSTAFFNFDPNAQVNFVNIYYDAAVNADNLAGTGFGDGDLVMAGVFVGGSGVFTVPNTTLTDDLDGFGANDYPGIFTLIGNGSTVLEATVDDDDINQDRNFFQINVPFEFFLELAFNTSQITPFDQQNPAAQVVGIAPNFGTDGINTVNGLPGPGNTSADFLFQADANAAVTVIPEPSTMLLTGLGLLGLGAVGLRRRKQ